MCWSLSDLLSPVPLPTFSDVSQRLHVPTSVSSGVTCHIVPTCLPSGETPVSCGLSTL